MDKTPKCRPIPFSSAMVLALLAGRKTQTRRMLKEQPKFDFAIRYDGPCFDDPRDHYWERLEADGETPTEDYKLLGRCPYGAPGDRLWVREQWRVENSLDNDKPSEISSHYPVDYAADKHSKNRNWMHPGFAGRWRSARFMPRWASRITLELLEVRVERLQDISEADALAEGILPNWSGDLKDFDPADGGYLPWEPDERECIEGADPCEFWETPVAAYEFLWDSLHGDKPGESWKDNPWVWVLSFKKLESEALHV